VVVDVVLVGASLIVAGTPLTLVRTGVTVEAGVPKGLNEIEGFTSIFMSCKHK
jgi:hypothetical protein